MLPTWCHSRVTTTKMHPVILQLLRDCTDGSLHPYMQESSEWANGSQMHATLPELKAAHPAPSIQDNGKARSSLWNVHRLIAGQSHAWFSLHLGREVVVLLIFPKTIETLNRFLGTSFNGWTSDCSPNAGPANNCHDHKTEGFVQPEVKHIQMAVLKHLPSHGLKASPKRLHWRLRQSFSWHKSEERVPAPCRYRWEHRDHCAELIKMLHLNSIMSFQCY